MRATLRDIYRFVQNGGGRYWIDLAIIAVLFGVALFQALGMLPLIDPDEGRYAEVPREMLELRDFITPHLNYVKYFAKPPLFYWMNAVSFLVFGQNEFAARFPSALCGLLGIILVYHIGHALFGRREALLSACILGTSIGWIVMGRLATIDMTVSVLITATLGFFFLASRANEPQKGSYYCLSYACAALGVLAKGLIGAGLPAAVILCSIVLHKRWGIVKEMRLLRGMCLFVLLCAPWFILVSIRNPGFLHRFFIYEHLGRYLRPDKEPSSPLFYVPVLLGLMFPWSCFIPAAVTRAVKGWKAENGECRLFLWLWALIIFCFFSASSTRLIPYVLPVFPAVALLLGDAVSGVFDRGFKPIRLQAYAAIIIMIIGGIGIMLYPHVATHPRLRARDCIPIGALALAEALFCLLAARRRDAVKFFLIMCALSYLLVIVGPHEVKENILKARSVKKLALIVREKAGPNDIVACYDWYDHEFPFYARRRIISVGHMGELEFGSAQGDQSAWFMSPGRFIDLWDSARQVFVLINEDDIPDFRNSVKRHPRMLGHEAKVMLVTNR